MTHLLHRLVGRRRSVLIFQLDGKVPNIACMRIAEHHRALGDSITFRWTGSPTKELWDNPDVVYASAIFEKTRPVADKLREHFPDAIIGGTGVDVASNLEAHGITTDRQDYSLYPNWRQSIGFTQRGCRLKCSFCVVPRKEGAIRENQTIWELWRGDPWPRELILLDNDFFGQPNWKTRIEEIRAGNFKVSFNQGINARFLTDEAAEAVASVDYRADDMKAKTLYTAWDNRRDERLLMDGLRRLVKYGVRPSHILVYVLIGYDHKLRRANPTLTEDDFFRRAQLREFGARPYPMPFVRTPELVGFQRWCIGHYDREIPWADFSAAKFEPRKLGTRKAPIPWSSPSP